MIDKPHPICSLHLSGVESGSKCARARFVLLDTHVEGVWKGIGERLEILIKEEFSSAIQSESRDEILVLRYKLIKQWCKSNISYLEIERYTLSATHSDFL
jgi:hypothetical protein